MAKTSGGEKFPFFQEARLKITICIRFRSVRLSEFVIEVDKNDRRMISTKNCVCNSIYYTTLSVFKELL